MISPLDICWCTAGTGISFTRNVLVVNKWLLTWCCCASLPLATTRTCPVNRFPKWMGCSDQFQSNTDGMLVKQTQGNSNDGFSVGMLIEVRSAIASSLLVCCMFGQVKRTSKDLIYTVHSGTHLCVTQTNYTSYETCRMLLGRPTNLVWGTTTPCDAHTSSTTNIQF